jgi:hypothetical protein
VQFSVEVKLLPAERRFNQQELSCKVVHRRTARYRSWHVWTTISKWSPALARGYVTYGSDSGHQTPGDSFYQNAQAAANYGHEAVKRTKDLTTAFVEAYYGKAARRNYQIGGSKGGQEGLQAAQRYYADFDGVVARFLGVWRPAMEELSSSMSSMASTGQ